MTPFHPPHLGEIVPGVKPNDKPPEDARVLQNLGVIAATTTGAIMTLWGIHPKDSVVVKILKGAGAAGLLTIAAITLIHGFRIEEKMPSETIAIP